MSELFKDLEAYILQLESRIVALESAIVKKPRGRPPKPTPEVVIKRGRGRPRKCEC